MHSIEAYERDLTAYAYEALSDLSKVKLIGEPSDRVPIFSFLIRGAGTEEVGTHLNKYGIAVRTGHHCTQPLLRFYDLDATVRASLCLYNTRDEVDAMIRALHKL